MDISKGGFIKNIIIIGVILTAAFLSQGGYFKNTSKFFNFPLLKKGSTYSDNSNNSNLAKETDLVKESQNYLKNIYSNVSGEAVKRTDMAKNEISNVIGQQKNNIENNSIDAVKKFLAEKVLQTLGITPHDLVNPKTLECQK